MAKESKLRTKASKQKMAQKLKLVMETPQEQESRASELVPLNVHLLEDVHRRLNRKFRQAHVM